MGMAHGLRPYWRWLRGWQDIEDGSGIGRKSQTFLEVWFEAEFQALHQQIHHF
jgi:hypothetical protein